MNSTAWASLSLVRNERVLHSVMAVVLIACLVGNGFLRRSFAASIEQIVVDKEDCKSLCDMGDSLVESVEKAKNRKDELEQEFQEILARVPKLLQDSDVLSNIRNVVLKSHCSLVDFRPAATLDRKEFKSRSYDLQMEGNFKQLVQFFDLLQHAPFVFQVSRFKISEPSALGLPCKAEMELRVVFDHVLSAQESIKHE
jgi:Tfp pilus assembly protein PilO